MWVSGDWAIRLRNIRPFPAAIRALQEALAHALALLPSQAVSTMGQTLVRGLVGGATTVFAGPGPGERAAWATALGRGEVARITAASQSALAGHFSLLGARFSHGARMPRWHLDPLTNYEWPRATFFKRINYLSATMGTDVKRVWELSRLQWLVPCAQSHALHGATEESAFIFRVLRSFRAENPVCRGVNWSCTLEPALRLLSLVHLRDLLLAHSPAEDTRLINTMIAEHWLFVAAFIEYGAVRGNHYFGDIVALVVGAVALRGSLLARRILRLAVVALEHEICAQLGGDGVQLEGSTSYHRFVLELAVVGCRAAQIAGIAPDAVASGRLRAASQYAVAYTRDDGTVPLLGDADEARAATACLARPSDHRYLANLVDALDGRNTSTRNETGAANVLWYFGLQAAEKLQSVHFSSRPGGSAAFRESGYFILRNGDGDHVFVDASTVGLKGRGGHGHNDCLSFELMLMGQWLLAEGGCSVYSSDPARRREERSTALHNTPIINGLEQNDLVGLWFVRERTHPHVDHWTDSVDITSLGAGHDGYVSRAGTRIERRILLEHAQHRVVITDVVSSSSDKVADFEEGFVVAPGVQVSRSGAAEFLLKRNAHQFVVSAHSASGALRTVRLDDVQIGVCYGTRVPARRMVFDLSHVGPRTQFELRVEPR
jgi:hypothetical protein